MAAKKLTSTQSLKRLLKVPLSGALDRLSPERLEREVTQRSSDAPEPTIGEMLQSIDQSKIFDPFNGLAGLALSSPLLTKPYEDAITAAFRAFKLDSKNPFNWRLLVGLLAYAHFGDPRRRGREKEWTSERYCQLLEDIDRLKSRNGRLSDSKACELLKKGEFRTRYQKQTSGRLRGALKEARDPTKNIVLASLIQGEIAQRRVAGVILSKQDERKMTLALGKKYGDAIGRDRRQTPSD
jgi:hypothetical protein